MGAVTGKGLSDLIREEFRTAHHLSSPWCVAAWPILGKYRGGVRRYRQRHGDLRDLEVSHRAHPARRSWWLVIVRGSYKPVERILILPR